MSGAETQPKWALAEGVTLAVVALACLTFQVWLPSTHVAEADYQAVAATLSSEGQPGDAVLLAPWWTERARLFIPDQFEVVGFQGSDGVDLPTHPRVWVLAEPDLPRAGLSGFMSVFGASRTEVGQERRFGKLSLRLFNNGRARPVVFDGNAMLEQAQVYLEAPNGERQSCTWNGRGMQCPNGRTVSVEWHEVHFEPLRCLSMDAPGGSTKLVVEWPQAPNAAQVVVRAGYIWERQAYRDGVTSSDVGLEVDGATSVLNVPAGVEQPAFTVSREGGARVRVWVTSQNPHARNLCVSVTGFGRAP